MTLFTDAVPHWLSLLFIIAIPIPVIMIALLAKKGSEQNKAQKHFWTIIAFCVIYLTYVFTASFRGLFAEVTLPPKILRFTMVPLLLFLFVVVSNLPAYRAILSKIALQDLVKVHIFRLMGSIFLFLGLYKALPSTISLIAGLGDVITALSSIYVAKCIQEGRSYARKLTLFWNTFGLLDIIATSASAFILTKLSIDTGSQGVDILGVFPFCFVPAFAPAVIIFLHVSIYRKLKQMS